MIRTIFILCFFAVSIFAQTETLTNAEVIEMSESGLGKTLILQKITSTNGKYDVSVKGLVELKKANVDDEIIQLMLEKAKTQPDVSKETITNQPNQANQISKPDRKTLSPKELLLSAKTMVISKSSINPSIASVEKQLLKRSEWNRINVAITEDNLNADLSLQIGFVHLSLITHRYTFRVYDRRTGILIAAGVTTSWGSLSANLARNIAQSLDKVLNETK
jgi:hypothetical protein